MPAFEVTMTHTEDYEALDEEDAKATYLWDWGHNVFKIPDANANITVHRMTTEERQRKYGKH